MWRFLNLFEQGNFRQQLWFETKLFSRDDMKGLILQEGADMLFRNIKIGKKIQVFFGRKCQYITYDKFRCEIISVKRCSTENLLHRKFLMN